MMADLITLQEAKDFVDETSFDRDPYIEALVAEVSSAIETYIGGPVINAGYTDMLDGDGSTDLWLRYFPVVEVSEVTIDDAPVTDAVSYESGLLYRVGGWTSGRKNVSVTYTAGRGATVPDDIKLAAQLLFHHIYKSYVVNVGGELGAYQALRVHSRAGWPPDVALILSRYRRKGR